MKDHRRRFLAGIIVLSVLISLTFIIKAYAASFITQLNTQNGAPTNTNPYQFYVCSDTSFGEGPAIEYSINSGPFTCNPCSFVANNTTSCAASVFQCTIPRQTSATIQYQFFNLSTFGDCGSSRSLFTGFKSFTTDGAGNSNPTIARISSFKVTAGKGGALLEWHTNFEVDNFGFNVYRERNGQRTLINPTIIAGSALVVGNGTVMGAGHSYIWRDPQGTLDSRYYLESVDLNGKSEMSNAVSPVAGSATSKQQQTKLLNELGADINGSAAPQPQREGPATLMSMPSTQTPTGRIEDQWAIAAQPGVKIQVNRDGWYRISQADLATAGLNPAADAGNLQLFADAQEQPVRVSRSSGPLSSGDYIEFYGRRLDIPTTDTHIYYLVAGSTAGKRIRPVGNLKPDSSKDTPDPVHPTPAPNESTQKTGSVIWGILMPLIFPERVALESIVAGKNSDDRNNAGETKSATETTKTDEMNSSSEKKTAASAESPAVEKPATETPIVETTPAKPSPAATPSVNQNKREKTRRRQRKSRRARKALAKNERNHYSLSGADASAAQSFSYTVELKERTYPVVNYYTALLNGDKENFFGRVVASLPVTQTLTLHNIDTKAQGSVILEVALQGVSPQSHEVQILFNDVLLDTAKSFYHDYKDMNLLIDPALIHEGDNVVTLKGPGAGDLSLIDYVRLTYAHAYRAENNSLRFSLRSNQTARVDGFTTSNIRLVDITDPLAVQEIRPTMEPSAAGFALIVGSEGRAAKGRRTLMAFPADQFSAPAGITPNQPSSLNRSDQSADLVVITHHDFLQGANQLAAFRRSQGLLVSVVDVEDVFDEFSYGTHAPQALKDFLFSATHWTKAPHYVLLVGDASYDPRNYFLKGNFDFVPTKLIDTGFMETASDDWLADFNNDGVPEMSVGRLPVRTTTDASRMISKIMSYTPSAPESVVLVADQPTERDVFDFASSSDELKSLFPAAMNVQSVYLGHMPSAAATRSQIISDINQGPTIVNYIGHGNVDIWSGQTLFTTVDAGGLTNTGHQPLFVMMTCLNGYFIDPTLEAMSETLMKADKAGAVAVWTSSGLTDPTGQHQVNIELYRQLFSQPTPTLGDAMVRAKAATFDTDVRRTWILFGDPTMKIR